MRNISFFNDLLAFSGVDLVLGVVALAFAYDWFLDDVLEAGWCLGLVRFDLRVGYYALKLTSRCSSSELRCFLFILLATPQLLSWLLANCSARQPRSHDQACFVRVVLHRWSCLGYAFLILPGQLVMRVQVSVIELRLSIYAIALHHERWRFSGLWCHTIYLQCLITIRQRWQNFASLVRINCRLRNARIILIVDGWGNSFVIVAVKRPILVLWHLAQCFGAFTDRREAFVIRWLWCTTLCLLITLVSLEHELAIGLLCLRSCLRWCIRK